MNGPVRPVDTTGLRILRFVVPIDDCWHELHVTGDPLHVAVVDDGQAVQFWAPTDPTVAPPPDARWWRVVGTGRLLPPYPVRLWGSAVASYPGGRGVWHLLESAQVRS